MFNFTPASSKGDDRKVSSSLNESMNNLSNVVAESFADIGNTIQGYKNLMREALDSNGNEYNDEVKTILAESSKDVISRAIQHLEGVKSSFEDLKKNLTKSYTELLRGNTEVVEKYEPLLKQLDTSRLSYEIPLYNRDTLPTSDMLNRLMNCINNDLAELTTGGVATDEEVNSARNTLISRKGQLLDHVKHVVLGMSSTLDVTNKFYELARGLMVDEKEVVTKYFSEDVFTNLMNVYDSSHINEIDAIKATLDNTINKFKRLQAKLVMGDGEGNEYTNSDKVSRYIVMKTILSSGLQLIGEIIMLRFQVLQEESTNYRKIVINTYESLTNTAIIQQGEQLSESYKPIEDLIIECVYPECSQELEIF